MFQALQNSLQQLIYPLASQAISYHTNALQHIRVFAQDTCAVCSLVCSPSNYLCNLNSLFIFKLI